MCGRSPIPRRSRATTPIKKMVGRRAVSGAWAQDRASLIWSGFDADDGSLAIGEIAARPPGAQHRPADGPRPRYEPLPGLGPGGDRRCLRRALGPENTRRGPRSCGASATAGSSPSTACEKTQEALGNLIVEEARLPKLGAVPRATVLRRRRLRPGTSRGYGHRATPPLRKSRIETVRVYYG